MRTWRLRQTNRFIQGFVACDTDRSTSVHATMNPIHELQESKMGQIYKNVHTTTIPVFQDGFSYVNAILHWSNLPLGSSVESQ